LKQKGARGMGIPLELAEVEDNIWRMSAIMDSLRKGEDIGVALEKGRVSMFDYGSLAKWEQDMAAYLLLFYTFTRNNIVHTLNNLFHHPNRMKNALMLRKDITKLLVGEEADDLMWYAPHWASARPILSFTQGVDKETYYTAAPAIVPIEGMSMVMASLSSLSEGDVPGVVLPLTNLLSPELNIILGRDRMLQSLRPGVMDARDVALLKHNGVWWAFTGIVGEVPVGVEARPGETTYDGKRWTLSDNAWERYKRMKSFANFTGASTLAQDWVQVYGITTDRAEGRQLEAKPFEALGFETQIGGVSPEQARTFSALEREHQLKSLERRRK